MTHQKEVEINGEKFMADIELIPLLTALNASGLITNKHCAGHHPDEPAWVVIEMKNIENIEVRKKGKELKVTWRR